MGKSPLGKSLGKFYPARLVLVNRRTPRPGAVDGADYHFRTRAQVDMLRADRRYAVLEARGDLTVRVSKESLSDSSKWV